MRRGAKKDAAAELESGVTKLEPGSSAVNFQQCCRASIDRISSWSLLALANGWQFYTLEGPGPAKCR
jgi:hypothetical protein